MFDRILFTIAFACYVAFAMLANLPRTMISGLTAPSYSDAFID